MPRPRRAFPRRRLHAPRLVVPRSGETLAQPDDWRIDNDESLHGWRVGLTAAHYLRRYFPGFWKAHVAQRPVTTSRLIGVFHAFLELANAGLLALDTDYHCPLRLGTVERDEIPELIDGYRDEGGVLYTIATELWYWLYTPPVLTYGISADALAVSWADGEHRLYLALLWMLRHTSWKLMGVETLDLRSMPGGRRVAALPALHQDVPMGPLADALSWSCPLDGITAPWTLGTVLRFVCCQTDNEFADLSPDEALQDAAWWCEGVYSNRTRLLEEMQKQAGARQIRAVYDALNARVTKEPALLTELATALVDTAYGAAAKAARVVPLVEVLAAAGKQPDPRAVPTEEALCAM